VPEGLIFGYPMRSDGKKHQIVQGLELNEFGKEKFNATLAELVSERDAVAEML
jgi:malate dehydrogenase